jgi:hypothetical protein
LGLEMLDLEFVKLVTPNKSVHRGVFRGLTAKPVQLVHGEKRSRALRLLQKDKPVATL